jgi:hypothetical protein
MTLSGRWEARTLRAEKFAGDVESLAADNNDLLAVEELLGDDAGEATEEVALAVDDDLVVGMLAAGLISPESQALHRNCRVQCRLSQCHFVGCARPIFRDHFVWVSWHRGDCKRMIRTTDSNDDIFSRCFW